MRDVSFLLTCLLTCLLASLLPCFLAFVILQACVRAFDKNWHEECLKCDACKKPLGTQYFTVGEELAPCCNSQASTHACTQTHTYACTIGLRFFSEGQTMCKPCFEDLSRYKCVKCKESITDAAISALSGYWHEDCFTCWVSGQSQHMWSCFKWKREPPHTHTHTHTHTRTRTHTHVPCWEIQPGVKTPKHNNLVTRKAQGRIKG